MYGLCKTETRTTTSRSGSKKGSLEIRALQMMMSLPSPRNIIIPGRLFECEASYIYLMPQLELVGMGPGAPAMTWDTMLDQLYTMIDVRSNFHL